MSSRSHSQSYTHNNEEFHFSSDQAYALFHARGQKKSSKQSIKPLDRRGSFYNEFCSCDSFVCNYQEYEPEDFRKVSTGARDDFKRDYEKFGTKDDDRKIPDAWKKVYNNIVKW
jgi:hypothetical protein